MINVSQQAASLGDVSKSVKSPLPRLCGPARLRHSIYSAVFSRNSLFELFLLPQTIARNLRTDRPNLATSLEPSVNPHPGKSTLISTSRSSLALVPYPSSHILRPISLGSARPVSSARPVVPSPSSNFLRQFSSPISFTHFTQTLRPTSLVRSLSAWLGPSRRPVTFVPYHRRPNNLFEKI